MGAALQRRRCAGSLGWGVCGLVLCLAGPALGQSDDENARRHFESGVAYLQQSNYDDALREFQSAYALSKRPALLLNIATVYERMGKLGDAVDQLVKYLAQEPDSPEKTTLETRIGNLKKRMQPGPAASTSPPASASPASSAPAAAAPATSAPPPSPAPAPAAPDRTLAYVAFGAAGAAAIGAVVTGLVAKSKFDDADRSCKPGCPDSTVDPIRSMALLSDVLTGVAVVGAGVGAVLFFTAKPGSERAARSGPWLSAGAGPGGGQVRAGFRF